MRKFITIALLILTSLNLHAIPLGNVFTYQGELTEAGQPANGAYTFNAHFYDAPSGGNLVDSHLNIIATVTNGLFSLPLDITSVHFQGEEIWIELEIVIVIRGTGANETLLPRQLITTTPYAIQAYFVSANGVNEDSIQNEVVSTTKLANGAVTNAKLDVSSVSSSNIINETIDTDDIKNGSIMAVDINTASVQQRVAGSCTAGNSIRAIAANGTVTCEPDSMGTSGWGLTGNAGTTPGTDFVGTTDNTDFVVKVNNETALIISPQLPASQFIPSTINLLFGNENTINKAPGSRVENVILGGGAANNFETTTSAKTVLGSTIAGGVGNSIANSDHSVIGGGFGNKINSQVGLVGSGWNNVIPGGSYNEIAASSGFAAGFGSKVNHTGAFVWNDYSDNDKNNSFATTADNQFLIRAEGGFGLGTNAPASPMHIKGQGTSTGSTAGSNEVILMLEPKNSSENVVIGLNKPSTTTSAALMFSVNDSPDFDIRTSDNRTGFLEFNHYPAGSKFTMMAYDYFVDASLREIEMSANINPTTTSTYNLGTSSLRWKTIYAQNPLDTPSDKRLKTDIVDIRYGLAEILEMRPVSYHWKKGDTQRVNLGLIAQEVETIVPEIVSKQDDVKQTRSMRYTELVPVLIKATQEQQVLIDQQTHQIKTLQAMVNTLLENNK